MKKWIYKIILIVAVVIFLCSGWNLYRIYKEYQAGSREYQELAQKVSLVHNTENRKTPTETTDQAEEETFLAVNFGALQEENPDMIGWVYAEKLGISYPIVQGMDNDYYLNHTFEGQLNGSGCIFADYQANPDFSDFNTFLYGHNMKNGTIFGSLKRLQREEGLYDEASYFYVYTRDFIYKYKICAYYVTAPDSDSYELVDTADNYKQYISKITKRSLRDCGVDELETSANMVTLSTCSGSGENKQRFLVHGLEVSRQQNIYY